jgi:hypothetical protein
MKINLTLAITLALIGHNLNAQVGIGTDNPKSTFEIKYKENSITPNGLLLPRVTVEQLDADQDNYNEDQHGALVYVTNAPGSGYKTARIFTEGIYFYNSTINSWQLTDTEPWMSADTGLPASKNSENIYQNATLGLGANMINETAQLDITSNNKGLLIPRLSTIQRNAIQNPANGLMIFNTTSSCLNYYDGTITRWLSMCGTYDPAKFDLLSCDSPVGPQGTYTQGTALNNSNTYTLIINVTEPGTFQILINTGNGYSYSASGLFTETGQRTIVLEGQGTPVNGPVTDRVGIKFNGIDIVPNCVLPTITVSGASTQFTLNCGSAQVFGEYFAGIAVNGTNYVDIPVTNVINPGQILLETPMINGIRFSTGSINVTASTTSIRLYAQGTPSATSTNTSYSFTTPTTPSTNCSFNVNVKSAKGTFAQPANRCTEILDDEPNSTDGYYWVRDASNNKYKTYCDMSNGGWTLVKSMSEKFILVDFRQQSESIGSQPGRGMVTTQTGKFNEYNFSVPAAVVNNIGSSTGTEKNFRFTIKEKGHTTAANATLQEIESSTIAPINDEWTKQNYWNVKTLRGNPATGNFDGNYLNHLSDGKIFGKTLEKNSITNNPLYAYFYRFDGERFAYNPPGLQSSAGFFTGFYGALGYVAPNSTQNNVTFTYPEGTTGAGQTFTYNKYYINDLFGLYMNSEIQLNHHIGTCSNSTDDFGGASYCNTGWANWRPHRINSINGSTTNFEGRIVQYWVK